MIFSFFQFLSTICFIFISLCSLVVLYKDTSRHLEEQEGIYCIFYLETICKIHQYPGFAQLFYTLYSFEIWSVQHWYIDTCSLCWKICSWWWGSWRSRGNRMEIYSWWCLQIPSKQIVICCLSWIWHSIVCTVRIISCFGYVV